MSSITIAELNKYFKEISLNKNTIGILGSMNADYTVTTEFLPKPGETVPGSPMKILPGESLEIKPLQQQSLVPKLKCSDVWGTIATVNFS